MSKEATFLIYCLERYRYHRSLTGAQVADLFEKYKVYDYVFSFFEALHTMAEPSILQDIDDYIASEKAALAS